MGTIKIDSSQYQKFLKDRNNYANIIAGNTDQEISDNKTKITTPAPGLYVTDFFYKNINDKFSVDSYGFFYNDPNYEEKIKNNKDKSSATSKKFKFDNKDIMKDLTTEGNNIFKTSFFNIAFPIALNDSIIIIVMSLIKLPFKIDFFFQNDGNDITTSPRIEDEYTDFYDNVLTKLKKNQADFKQNYEISLYQITDFTQTYNNFLRFIYGDSSIQGIKKIENELSIGGLGNNGKIVIDSDDKNISFVAGNDRDLELEFKNNDSDNRKIYSFNDTSRSIANPRKLYWTSCVENSTEMPNDKRDKKGANVNMQANYYDISFNCASASFKTFFFSYHSPGFHVVDFKSKFIYPNPNTVTLKKGESAPIKLNDLYKQIFLDRILIFTIDPL